MRLDVVLVGFSVFALACAPAASEQGLAAEHAALSSAGAAPSVGPEFPMDAPVQRSGGYMSLDEHAVAVDATGTALIVWTQGFRALAVAARGARVDQAGNLLDPTGFTITAAGGADIPRGVASNGDEWLVVSQDDVTGAATARRVSHDGTPLETTDIVIAPAVDGEDLRVAANGSDFWVSWIATDSTGSRRLLATRVLADGTVLDPDGILIAAGGLGTTQALSSGGTDTLVTWVNSSGVHGARLGADGTVLDSGGFTLSTDSTVSNLHANLQAAFDGESWLVGWSSVDRTQPSNPVTRVHARAVRADGTVVGTEPLSLSSTDIYGIASDGAGWSVLCQGSSTVHVSSDATTVGDLSPVAQKSCESFAYNGAHWVFPCLGGSDPSFAIDVTDVGWVEPLELANVQDSPAVAYNGSNFLVVWGDDRDTQSTDQTPVVDLYATRLSPAGTVLDAPGFPITHGFSARVSSDGQNWLVVTESAAGAVGRRVSALGQVLDASDIVFGSPESSAPDVYFNGENWLVVYATAAANTNEGGPLLATRVSTAGEVLDPDGIQIASKAYAGRQSITFDGANWVIGWVGANGTMALSFLSADGTKLVGHPISLPEGHTTNSPLALGYDSSGLFVAWEDYSESGRTFMASRVSSHGTLLDGDGSGVLLANISAELLGIDVARYGADWLVTWNVTPASGPRELDGAIFSSTGASPVVPFVVSATKQIAGAPALASGAGSLVVTYTATDALGTRVNARMIDYPCAGASDPLCEWSAASGGFAGAAGAAGAAAASGGEAGTAEVGGTSDAGGRPHVGSGGSSSGGTSHAGRASSNQGGNSSDSGGATGGGEAGERAANGGTGGSPHGGAPSGGSKNKGGGSGTAGTAAQPNPRAADSGCACRAAPASRSDNFTALIGLIAAAFAATVRRGGLVRRVPVRRRLSPSTRRAG